jgi:N-methylhydantoinase A/oxoprolinase/acetone carboxylase beta subunit
VPAPDCRLGIDVGGTNTDAVIMDAADQVIAKAKVPCTPDITGGIVAAIDTVLRAPGVDRAGSRTSCWAPRTPPTRCWSAASCTGWP